MIQWVCEYKEGEKMKRRRQQKSSCHESVILALITLATALVSLVREIIGLIRDFMK